MKGLSRKFSTWAHATFGALALSVFTDLWNGIRSFLLRESNPSTVLNMLIVAIIVIVWLLSLRVARLIQDAVREDILSRFTPLTWKILNTAYKHDRVYISDLIRESGLSNGDIRSEIDTLALAGYVYVSPTSALIRPAIAISPEGRRAIVDHRASVERSRDRPARI